MGRNLTRWLIPLPAILFAVIPQNANAEPVAGLNAVGYVVTEIPPTKSDTVYQTCGSEIENNINRNFNGEPFQQCPVDLFMVHYTGFITVPENNTIQFMIAADDGGVIGIGNTSFGTWNDKHCSWSAITTAVFPAATYALDGWFYEHGGSTCFMLAWNINGAGWAIVPDSAFTTNEVLQTTSTTSSTTTSSSTTTTTSTTSTTSSTTTLPIQTTTTTSTTLASTTTQTTTTTTVPATTTTTTEAPYVPTQTTSTTEPKTIVVVPNITAPETFITEPEKVVVPETTAPETFVTIPETITVPDTTEPKTFIPDPDGPVEEPVVPVETTILETFFPDYENGPVLDETEQPEEQEQIEKYIPETTELILDDSSSDIISDEQFEEILDDLEDASPEQVVVIIESILAADISSEQATELVSNVAVLQVISEEDAEQLFSEVVPADLTEEQAALIVEAVQAAPTEVRQAFEGVIDIFGSQFENYVPTGSNIPVSTRRTLVAIAATLTMLPTSRARR